VRYVTLPRTELRTSSICMGTVVLGSTVDRDGSFALLDRYVERGGNFIDTASVYANWLPVERHSSEKTIGRWLKARGNRKQLILATKGAHPELSSTDVPRMSRDEIVADLETSLRNLRTEAIDLYWLHRDDPERPVFEIMEVLWDQVDAGKICYLGCSNWRAARIRAAQAYAARHGRLGFVGDQMMWSLALVDPEALGDKTMVYMDDELMCYHQETGLAAIAYSSQARGAFQKMARGDEVPRVYRRRGNEDRFQRVKRLAAQSGLTITQVVLGYMQSQSFTTVPIVGCRTLEQLDDSLDAADVRLTSEQVRYLEAG